MTPPIDLARTMTIQIPALEWVNNSNGYWRVVDGVTQTICPHAFKGPLASDLDMEGCILTRCTGRRFFNSKATTPAYVSLETSLQDYTS